MTELPALDEPLDEESQFRRPVNWEIPEILCVAVLTGVVVLAMGGLATGIARAVTVESTHFPPSLSSQEVWNAIQFGSAWAGPLVAAVLLGALGLCWWQAKSWAEAAEIPDDDPEVLRHLLRAHFLARWAIVVLVLTAGGSIAGFVAQVGADDGGQVWPIDIGVGASLLAVVVFLGAGFWGVRLFSRQYPTSTVAGIDDPE